MRAYEYLSYTASANFAPSAFTDWVDEQTVMTAGDVVAPAAPVFAPGDIEGVNQGVKLTLHAPTLNADGTPCRDFSHFRVYYNTTTPVGTSFHVETSASSYTMPTEVTLHFAVAAVDVRGNVGAVSGEQSASPIFTTGGAGEIAIQGWQSDIEFTAATHNKVNWAAGRIWLMDGKTYSIVAGNTGIMSALTFIYLDIGVSNTVLQTTTTPSLAVGRGKILVGVAGNAPDASKSATFQIFSGSGGQGVLIGTNNIKAGSVTANLVAANEIITNTANISDAVISSAKIISLAAAKVDAVSLSAISADLGTINAGTITGALLRTAATGWRVEMQSGATPLRYWNGATTRFSVDSSGNVAIAGAITILSGSGVGNLADAGTLATRNTVAGVHIDSNAVTAAKINVSTLSAITANLGTITAGTITGALLRTAATGWRVEMQSGATPLRYWNGATTRFSVDSSGNVAIAGAITILSGSGVGNLADAGTLATRNTVAGVHIDSNAVTADKINVSALSAITANLGELTAGTITGALLRTAATGWRVEMRFGAMPLRYWNGTSTRFSVDWSGNVAIAGAITILSGSGVGNLTDAGTLATRNTVAGVHIDSNAVTAAKINVTSLSAITANLGSITAGTVTGALLRTAATGWRVEMRSGAIPLRYWNGTTTRFSIDSSGNVAITGALTAGSGSSIHGSYVNNINANTITAGTITGRTLRTATSGVRIIIAPTYGGLSHRVWALDSANIVRSQLSAGSLKVGRDGNHAAIILSSRTDTTAFIRILRSGGEATMMIRETPSIIFYRPGTIGGQNSANMVTLQNTIGRMSPFTASWSVVLGTGWTNISLANVVGSRRGLVFLRVRNRAGGPRNLRFRPDGDTRAQHPHADAFPGVCSTRVDTANEFNYVWVLTSSTGVIEASADATVTVVIEPLAFIT